MNNAKHFIAIIRPAWYQGTKSSFHWNQFLHFPDLSEYARRIWFSMLAFEKGPKIQLFILAPHGNLALSCSEILGYMIY